MKLKHTTEAGCVPLFFTYFDDFELSFNYRVVPFCSCMKPVFFHKRLPSGAGPD